MSEKQFYITDTGLGLDTVSDEIYNFGNEEDFCRLFDKLNEQQATIRSLKKENRALNSIKKFAEDNGINIFYIDTAFRNCWNDNAKLIEENEQLRKHCDCKEEIIKEQERRIIVLENLLTNIGVKWVDDDE